MMCYRHLENCRPVFFCFPLIHTAWMIVVEKKTVTAERGGFAVMHELSHHSRGVRPYFGRVSLEVAGSNPSTCTRNRVGRR